MHSRRPTVESRRMVHDLQAMTTRWRCLHRAGHLSIEQRHIKSVPLRPSSCDQVGIHQPISPRRLPHASPRRELPPNGDIYRQTIPNKYR